jgi:ketosteroid isomerase-like protein
MADPCEQVVRAYFDAWNRRDLDALAATLHRDVEWQRSAEFPEGRTLRGREGVVDFAASMFDVFEQTPIDLRECLDAGAGEVIAAGTSRFKGTRSGAETSSSWVRVYSVRDGVIIAVRQFETREQAEAAVGSR